MNAINLRRQRKKQAKRKVKKPSFEHEVLTKYIPKNTMRFHREPTRAQKIKRTKRTRRVKKWLLESFSYRRIARTVTSSVLLAFAFVGSLEITAPLGYTVSFFFSVIVVFLLIDAAWRKA